MITRPITAGDVLHLTRAASPQFVKPIFVRVIREMPLHTYYGWTWVEGYQLDAAGDAVAKRELFVLREGLIWLAAGLRPAALTRRQPARDMNRVPAS
ncbi:hypothetical protein OOK41_25730 [Micromonospora sp. NBC_01655]|uniref:hypothetical protein n=1 Tax=Micromonospora sp. NBC_01655 TaxID=2975983 RepID=UPI0022529D01|nr:hypothetical protein [Micromonospora sp. NBC_01655]MCX4473661.1 hypothetical protein [Micromonospora sp. NBC_01655]